MQAIVNRRYGPPEGLRLEEIEKPVPGADQVLVRVRAASVNPADWHMMRGSPALVRLMGGLRRPREIRFGSAAAGTVEAVGADVTHVQPGDDVFGTRTGACAEYVCGKGFVHKPARLTFEQASTFGIAGCTALQGLRDKARLEPGQGVLVNGAAGGVGTFAVQIAKALGAEVTGVCSTRNVDMVRSIGADHVVDYTTDDFTKSSERYDVMLDCIGNHSLAERRRVLTPKGSLVLIGADVSGFGLVTSLLGPLVVSPFVGQRLLSFIAKITREDLTVLAELAEDGKITPVIDREYPLSDTSDAIRYLEAGHARGKVVITL
ncbi:MAG: NAD(P)-dependent alcohol dehydrogenase [Gaiellaceae bacterium]